MVLLLPFLPSILFTNLIISPLRYQKHTHTHSFLGTPLRRDWHLAMCSMKLGIFARLLLLGLLVIFASPFSRGVTFEQDVYAINNLYAALGSPPLPGWIPSAGDPCAEGWQGVRCIDANITGIILNGANLGGELGNKLANFTSIITIDLSNNHIGGSIPENLPITMREFFLSANQFTGSIPASLSGLTLLSAMSLNNNLLTGELPDAFQLLSSLTNLDLSFNNLTGQLPPSMQSLSSLTTMRVQNNQLSGTLDVLQDLPLKDLNIENNLFSGPVPPKLLNVPILKKDGNPFNTTIAPSSSAPPAPISGALPPQGTAGTAGLSGNGTSGSSSQDTRNSAGPSARTKKSSTKIVLIVFSVVAGVIFFIVLMIFVLNWVLAKLHERDSDEEKVSKRVGRGDYERPRMDPRNGSNFAIPTNEISWSTPTDEVSNDEITKVSKVPIEEPEEYEVDGMGVVVMPPPPVDKIIVNPIDPPQTAAKVPSPENISPPNPPTSAVSFSVASLQQYTNSFSEESLIREGSLGKVYQADLPDGKQLMVMKLDNVNSTLPVDAFFELVLSISELRHPNVVELVGYCAEYEQRLLVYNYFSKRTLHDILLGGDDLRGKLSWNARIQVALGAAKALEYLHEGCEQPVVHQNFESDTVLIDDELAVRVCDCGLASITPSKSVTQLSGRIRSLFSYEAPEISDSGSYTDRSDVYSFGVVMLELLTGREPYDSSRPRAEQYLVRWASSQLHDINTLSRMVDPAIDGKCPVKSLSRFADIISRCIQRGPEFRPQMSEVVQDLTRMVEEIKGRDGSSLPT